MGITWSRPVRESRIKWSTISMKFWIDRLWMLWWFVSVFFEHRNPQFLQIFRAMATSDWTSWENMHTLAHTHTHTHTHTSQLYIWERLLLHFLFPSLCQSATVVHICCRLICIPGWWGNSSLGLPLTADPNPSQTTGWPFFRFHYITHASKHNTTTKKKKKRISHSLEQAHVSGISKNPCALGVLSLLRMHEGRKLKADSGECISG